MRLEAKIHLPDTLILVENIYSCDYVEKDYILDNQYARKTNNKNLLHALNRYHHRQTKRLFDDFKEDWK